MDTLGLAGVMPIYTKGYPYNRFPVYVKDRSAKDALFKSGIWLGITPMYPSPVHRIRELGGSFDNRHFEGAENISNTLVTLPTHALLNVRDTLSIQERVRSVCPQGNRTDHDSQMGAGCH